MTKLEFKLLHWDSQSTSFLMEPAHPMILQHRAPKQPELKSAWYWSHFNRSSSDGNWYTISSENVDGFIPVPFEILQSSEEYSGCQLWICRWQAQKQPWMLNSSTMTWSLRGSLARNVRFIFPRTTVDKRVRYLVLRACVTANHGNHQNISSYNVQGRKHFLHPFRKPAET